MRSLTLLSDHGAVIQALGNPLPDVIGLLQEEQDLETLGIHSVFDGFYDPEEGAVGTIREERQLTDRGAMIEGYLRRLHLLSQKQRIMLARIAAERIINRKLGF